MSSARTILITGASSGIGLAIAEKHANAGDSVIGLDLQAGQLEQYGTWISCDIADADSVDAAFDEIARLTPVIDVLVNNAGVGAVGTVETSTDADWWRVLSVNVVGTARVSRAALPLLRQSAAPAIVNIASFAAAVGIPARAAYSASKGAVQTLTLAMAADHIGEGIRVNCINPGTADTPWVQRLLENSDNPDADAAKLRQRQPTGRLVTGQEIASAAYFLCHPDQRSITGAVLAVDGGIQTLRTPQPDASSAL